MKWYLNIAILMATCSVAGLHANPDRPELRVLDYFEKDAEGKVFKKPHSYILKITDVKKLFPEKDNNVLWMETFPSFNVVCVYSSGLMYIYKGNLHGSVNSGHITVKAEWIDDYGMALKEPDVIEKPVAKFNPKLKIWPLKIPGQTVGFDWRQSDFGFVAYTTLLRPSDAVGIRFRVYSKDTNGSLEVGGGILPL